MSDSTSVSIIEVERHGLLTFALFLHVEFFFELSISNTMGKTLKLRNVKITNKRHSSNQVYQRTYLRAKIRKHKRKIAATAEIKSLNCTFSIGKT